MTVVPGAESVEAVEVVERSEATWSAAMDNELEALTKALKEKLQSLSREERCKIRSHGVGKVLSTRYQKMNRRLKRLKALKASASL